MNASSYIDQYHLHAQRTWRTCVPDSMVPIMTSCLLGLRPTGRYGALAPRKARELLPLTLANYHNGRLSTLIATVE